MPPVKRWVFNDPTTGETYTVPLNPREMSSPHPVRAVRGETTTAVGGLVILWEGNTPPTQWSFSGRILMKAHYDALLSWSQKQVRIRITDHYGRIYTVVPISFAPKDKRARSYHWSHDYEFTCIIAAGPTAATVGD